MTATEADAHGGQNNYVPSTKRRSEQTNRLLELVCLTYALIIITNKFMLFKLDRLRTCENFAHFFLM